MQFYLYNTNKFYIMNIKTNFYSLFTTYIKFKKTSTRISNKNKETLKFLKALKAILKIEPY